MVPAHPGHEDRIREDDAEPGDDRHDVDGDDHVGEPHGEHGAED
jgi:hypothetical protein